MTVLIDSWSWIEYFQGTPKGRKAREYIEGNEKAIVSTINIAEVYRHMLAYGSRGEAEFAVKYIAKSSFIVPVSSKIAVEAAKIKHEKKWGLGDSLILATANDQGAKVVTGDGDFRNEKAAVFIE